MSAIIGAALAAITIAAPASSFGATIGPELPAHRDKWVPCSQACELAQVRIAGEPVVAPFTGKITSFRVEGAQGTFRLQVLRKRPHGGYKALRETRRRRASVAGSKVARFRMTRALHIDAGDYIGLRMGDDTRISMRTAQRHSCFKGFLYPIQIGDSAQPYPRTCRRWTALYNADLAPR